MLVGGKLLVRSDSSFNRQENCLRMVPTRMWMEPKVRALGAPQRYTNVTAMNYASNAHDYTRSRISNGIGDRQTCIGALYFPEFYHGGHWPPRTACGANFAYEYMQEGSQPCTALE